jgi:hypothetical protein
MKIIDLLSVRFGGQSHTVGAEQMWISPVLDLGTCFRFGRDATFTFECRVVPSCDGQSIVDGPSSPIGSSRWMTALSNGDVHIQCLVNEPDKSVRVRVVRASTGYTVTSDALSQTTSGFHVAVVAQAGMPFALYIDGHLVGGSVTGGQTTTHAVRSVDSFAPLFIGASAAPVSGEADEPAFSGYHDRVLACTCFRGVISEVCVWGRSLSPPEVATRVGTVLMDTALVGGATNGDLRGYWPLRFRKGETEDALVDLSSSSGGDSNNNTHAILRWVRVDLASSIARGKESKQSSNGSNDKTSFSEGHGRQQRKGGYAQSLDGHLFASYPQLSGVGLLSSNENEHNDALRASSRHVMTPSASGSVFDSFGAAEIEQEANTIRLGSTCGDVGGMWARAPVGVARGFTSNFLVSCLPGANSLDISLVAVRGTQLDLCPVGAVGLSSDLPPLNSGGLPAVAQRGQQSVVVHIQAHQGQNNMIAVSTSVHGYRRNAQGVHVDLMVESNGCSLALSPDHHATANGTWTIQVNVNHSSMGSLEVSCGIVRPDHTADVPLTLVSRCLFHAAVSLGQMEVDSSGNRGAVVPLPVWVGLSCGRATSSGTSLGQPLEDGDVVMTTNDDEGVSGRSGGRRILSGARVLQWKFDALNAIDLSDIAAIAFAALSGQSSSSSRTTISASANSNNSDNISAADAEAAARAEAVAVGLAADAAEAASREWTCGTCTCRNPNANSLCSACNTPNSKAGGKFVPIFTCSFGIASNWISQAS